MMSNKKIQKHNAIMFENENNRATSMVKRCWIKLKILSLDEIEMLTKHDKLPIEETLTGCVTRARAKKYEIELLSGYLEMKKKKRKLSISVDAPKPKKIKIDTYESHQSEVSEKIGTELPIGYHTKLFQFLANLDQIFTPCYFGQNPFKY